MHPLSNTLERPSSVDTGRIAAGESRASLSEQAYGELRNRILLGRGEGTAWHSVKAIADELGVSRTPVREALVRLHNEHLLERDSAGRLAPATITYSRAADIFVTRAANEGMAARLAAVSATFEQVSALKEICAASWESHKANERAKLIDQNDEFHSKLLQIADTKGLSDAIDKSNALLYKYRQTTLINPERIVRSLEAHDRITKLVAAHMPEEAETAAREHVFAAGRVFINAIALFVQIDRESPSTRLIKHMTHHLSDL